MKEGFGEQDIVEIWGGNGGKRWNGGAGPMMVLPKVSIGARMHLGHGMR
jgi:hypothetical protein